MWERGCRSVSGVTIKVGEFHIEYDKFLGYCAPGEHVRRPLRVENWRDVMYQWQKDGYTPVPVQVEIPEGITAIGERAFKHCTALTAVSVSDTVVSIGREAFAYCSALARVHLPDSVTEIGDSAFAGCDALEEITLPKALSGQAKRIFENLDEISWRWFSGKLQVNPELANTLGASLRRRREDIARRVVSAEDVETLERYFGLWKKVSLDFLEELIEMSVQSKKASITAMLLQYKDKQYSPARTEQAHQRRMEMELGVREPSITEWHRMFVFHEEDGKIVITGCKRVSPVVAVPASIGGKPVTVIERWTPRARKEPDKVYSVVLPEGVREIGAEAFKGCNLESITLPASVTNIGQGAFSHCKHLTSVTLPPVLDRIEDETFFHCDALESVSIPESLREIDLDAFCECPNLDKIVLPARVKKVYASRWRWEERERNPYWRRTSRVVASGAITRRTLQEANVDFVY